MKVSRKLIFLAGLMPALLTTGACSDKAQISSPVIGHWKGVYCNKPCFDIIFTDQGKFILFEKDSEYTHIIAKGEYTVNLDTLFIGKSTPISPDNKKYLEAYKAFKENQYITFTDMKKPDGSGLCLNLHPSEESQCWTFFHDDF